MARDQEVRPAADFFLIELLELLALGEPDAEELPRVPVLAIADVGMMTDDDLPGRGTFGQALAEPGPLVLVVLLPGPVPGENRLVLGRQRVGVDDEEFDQGVRDARLVVARA